jgi:hypothetical protein
MNAIAKNWVCAKQCGSHATTYDDALPHHSCREFGGLTVPLIVAGTKAELIVVEREDYVGSELVQTNDAGRPVMSVITRRDDGEDCTIYAPTAGAVVEGVSI